MLNDKPDDRQKDLTFIPLAPACVVSSFPNIMSAFLYWHLKF
jgi:hypothetical protein